MKYQWLDFEWVIFIKYETKVPQGLEAFNTVKQLIAYPLRCSSQQMTAQFSEQCQNYVPTPWPNTNLLKQISQICQHVSIIEMMAQKKRKQSVAQVIRLLGKMLFSKRYVGSLFSPNQHGDNSRKAFFRPEIAHLSRPKYPPKINITPLLFIRNIKMFKICKILTLMKPKSTEKCRKKPVLGALLLIIVP